MSHIVVNSEQAKLLLAEGKSVEFRDAQENLLGHFVPLDITPDEIAAIKRSARSCKRWYTTAQVQNHLKFLEEALEREGSFDAVRMRELLNEARARDEI